MVVGVILAGGESRRFGGNKLLADVEGIKVIDRVFEAVNGVTDKIYISVNNEEQAAVLEEHCGFAVSSCFKGFIYDDESFQGPMAGLMAGIKDLSDDILFVPGDIPWITTKSLSTFIDIVRDYGLDVASPVWGNGMIESLVIYVDKRLARIVADFPWDIRPSARPTDFIRVSEMAGLIPVSNVTGDPTVFAHVNVVEDLHKPRLRNPVKGFIRNVVIFDRGGGGSRFWEAWVAFGNHRYSEAVRHLYMEMGDYIENSVYHLVRHVAMDISYIFDVMGRGGGVMY